MSAARFFIAGKVQGVWFRASTREQAVALELRGYASNLRDGRVEVLAVGEEAAIERLAQWLHRGPPMARVDTVLREVASEHEAGDGFVCG
ncbi:MAG: acylphosphatase [Lysobacter sp.]|nr:acylphosphatase [Lysobacter sp.]